MVLIQKFIVAKTLKYFLSIIALCTLLFTLIQVIRFTAFDKIGLSPSLMIQTLFFALPTIIILILPIAWLLAVSITLGFFKSTKGVFAANTLGYKTLTLYKPLLKTSLIISVLSLALNCFAEPWSMKWLRYSLSKGVKYALLENISAEQFYTLPNGFSLIANKNKDDSLNEIVITDISEEKNPMVLRAKKGALGIGSKSNIFQLNLERGKALTVSSLDKLEKSAVYEQLSFEKATLHFDIKSHIKNQLKGIQFAQSLYPNELVNYYNKTKSKKKKAIYLSLLHRKIAISSAAILFTIMLLLLYKNQSPNYSAIIGGVLISVLLYYYIGRFFELEARKGILSAALAPWVPNLLLVVVIALFMVIRIIKKESFL